MAIDLRSGINCSLGPLISGSISDSYIQGSGLVFVSGSCVINGVITPSVGTTVDFSYTKNGLTRTIPRKLRVLSSFADPYRRTTSVSLGCKLTYLEDLRDPIDWSAMDDPENSQRSEDEIVTVPIHASSVANKCLNELGITASSNPLTNQFSIARFDFSGGYVSILSELLVSESYCGYLDQDEILQIFSLNQEGGTGPVINSEDLVDLGPINVGDLPGEAVIVSYSSLKLKQKEGEEPVEGGEFPGWERTQTFNRSTAYISYTTTNPNGEEVQLVEQYQAFQDSTTTIDYKNKSVLEPTGEWQNKRVVDEKITYDVVSSISEIGNIATQYRSAGITWGNIPLTKRTIESYEYDSNGNESFRQKVEIGSQEFLIGGFGIPWVLEAENGQSQGAYSPGRYEEIVLGKEVTRSETIISSGRSSSVTTTEYYVPWSLTIPGQHAISEARETFSTAQDVVNFIDKMINLSTLVLDRVVTNLSPRGPTQSAPEREDIINAGNIDPNYGYGVSRLTMSELAIGSAEAQRRIEFSMPYAPDDIFTKSGNNYYASPSDAQQKARTYGIVQNSLLLGNRSGVNIQTAPERIPHGPFSPIVLNANGLSALYRINGLTWTMDSEGIVVSSDLIFWGAVGGTGDFWFPVAPGVTVLPETPPIEDTTPSLILGSVPTVQPSPQTILNTAFPGASLNNAVVDSLTNDFWKFNGSIWQNIGPVPGPTITVQNVIPAWNETLRIESPIYTKISIQSFPYALSLSTSIAIAIKTKITAIRENRLNVQSGNIEVAAQPATFVEFGRTLKPSNVVVSVNTLAPTLAILPGTRIEVASVNIFMQGRIGYISQQVTLAVPVSSILIQGGNVTIQPVTLLTESKSILVSTLSASIVIDPLVINAVNSQITLGSPAPTLDISFTVTPYSASINLSSLSPSLSIDAIVYPYSAAITVTPLLPIILGSTVVAINSININVASPAPSVSIDSGLELVTGSRVPELGATSTVTYDGWSRIIDGSRDDTWILTGNFGFTFTIDSAQYSTCYVGSNGYLTFGGGATNYSNLSQAIPSLRKIFFYPGDRSYQRVYTKIGTSQGYKYFAIRWEGASGTAGTPGSSVAITEIKIFESAAGKQYIELLYGINPSSGINGISIGNINTWYAQANFAPNTSYILEGNLSGTSWTITANKYVKFLNDAIVTIPVSTVTILGLTPEVNPLQVFGWQISSASPSDTSQTLSSLSQYAGAEAGDLLIAVLMWRSDQGTLTAPSGWSLHGTYLSDIRISGGTVQQNLLVFTKITEQNEPENYTWSSTQSTRNCGFLVRLKNASLKSVTESYSSGSTATINTLANGLNITAFTWVYADASEATYFSQTLQTSGSFTEISDSPSFNARLSGGFTRDARTVISSISSTSSSYPPNHGGICIFLQKKINDTIINNPGSSISIGTSAPAISSELTIQVPGASALYISTPVPTVTISNELFTTITYGAVDGIKQVSGLPFKPGLIWIHNINGGFQPGSIIDKLSLAYTNSQGYHTLWSTGQNDNYAVDDASTAFGAITSDGFTVPDGPVSSGPGDAPQLNFAPGYNYLTFAWKEGGAPTVNNDGSIQSIVSVNQDAGYSIFRYTGNSSSTATVGHGLDTKPEFVIFRDLEITSNTRSTLCAFSEEIFNLGSCRNMRFGVSPSPFNLCTAISQIAETNISIGNLANVNGPGQTFAGYAFVSRPGFSKISTYTGTGSGQLTVSGLGFDPVFVLVTRTGGPGAWYLGSTNPSIQGLTLQADDGRLWGDPGTGMTLGVDSFTIGTYMNANQSGEQYVYIAFGSSMPASSGGSADYYGDWSSQVYDFLDGVRPDGWAS